MCLKDVSLQLYTLQLKRRWGVCLAATPKDCHKPINTTRATTSPPTQMMSAFIRRVVIPPLVGCEAAAVLLLVSAAESPKGAASPRASHRTTPHSAQCAFHSKAVVCSSCTRTLRQQREGLFFFGAKRQTRKCSTFHHRKAQPLLQLLWLQDFYKVSVPLHPSNPFIDFITTQITLSLNAAGINSEWENQVWCWDQPINKYITVRLDVFFQPKSQYVNSTAAYNALIQNKWLISNPYSQPRSHFNWQLIWLLMKRGTQQWVMVVMVNLKEDPSSGCTAFCFNCQDKNNHHYLMRAWE